MSTCFSQRLPCCTWFIDSLTGGRLQWGITVKKDDIHLGLGWVIFREGLRKWGFSLDWMLSRSQSNLMTEYFNNSYVEDRKEGGVKSIIGKRKYPLIISQDQWLVGYFVVLTVFLFLSVFGHDCEVILGLSQSILVRVTLSDVIPCNCVQEEGAEASSEGPAIAFWQHSLELERIVFSSLLHLWCLCGSG